MECLKKPARNPGWLSQQRVNQRSSDFQEFQLAKPPPPLYLDRRRALRGSHRNGWIPEWPNGADCKSAVFDFEGSNPSPPTILILSMLCPRPSVQGLAQGQLPAKGLKAKLFGTSPHLRPVPMATKETGQRVDVTRL